MKNTATHQAKKILTPIKRKKVHRYVFPINSCNVYRVFVTSLLFSCVQRFDASRATGGQQSAVTSGRSIGKKVGVGARC